MLYKKKHTHGEWAAEEGPGKKGHRFCLRGRERRIDGKNHCDSVKLYDDRTLTLHYIGWISANHDHDRKNKSKEIFVLIIENPNVIHIVQYLLIIQMALRCVVLTKFAFLSLQQCCIAAFTVGCAVSTGSMVTLVIVVVWCYWFWIAFCFDCSSTSRLKIYDASEITCNVGGSEGYQTWDVGW